jgi:hypothetical protein
LTFGAFESEQTTTRHRRRIVAVGSPDTNSIREDPMTTSSPTITMILAQQLTEERIRTAAAQHAARSAKLARRLEKPRTSRPARRPGILVARLLRRAYA